MMMSLVTCQRLTEWRRCAVDQKRWLPHLDVSSSGDRQSVQLVTERDRQTGERTVPHLTVAHLFVSHLSSDCLANTCEVRGHGTFLGRGLPRWL